jgi:cytochrome c oxidase subunit 3
MSAATQHGAQPYYFIPAPSRHPAMAALGLFFVIFGASRWINGEGWGAYGVLIGLLLWAFVMQQWFRDAIGESETGLYS